MRRLISILAAFAVCALSVWGQAPSDRREVRGGNRDFRRGDYKEAEIDYRRALVRDSMSVAANYNLANTLYRMEEYQEALKFVEVAEPAENPDVHYNKGDIALQNKDYNTAVEAFRRSLLLNPGDVEAKENYIYAKKMLENQQQNGGGGNNDQNQDQDKNNDQNQDQDNDQNNQNQNNNNNQDNNQDDGGQDPEGGQQPELSPQAAEQMLQAIEAKEKETQDKVKKEEALRARTRQKEKNW